VHFGFDDDQLALRDAVGSFLDKRADLAQLQRGWNDPADPAVWESWSGLAEMGVHGLLAPAGAGGSDLDWVTMALVLSEAGRVALPLPLADTAAVGVPFIAAAGDPLGILPGLAYGSAVLSAAPDTASLFPAVSKADWFLAGPVLYRRDEVKIEAVRSVDHTRDTGRITPLGAGTALAGDGPSVADLGALGAAAELIGLGRALVQMTVAYVKDRRQFGVPVGSFQAVKHHLADAALHVEFAAPAVWAAAYELDQGAPGAPGLSRSVSLAKALASDAANLAARKALQCHGAMGYTDDYHLHMWLKRVWCLAASYGSARWHRARVGDLLGLSR
jgi:alkylation response protein AidB-like acyl-CoA dehydrogenase